MNESMIYAYALGYHHAVAVNALDNNDKKDNNLSGELRAFYEEGFARGVMDNRIDMGVADA